MGARAPVAPPKRESVRFGTMVLAVARAGRFSLGFLASLLIARGFGASPETDAFFVARILPIIFMDWAGNILKVGFIPTHADVVAREGEAEGRRVALQFAMRILVAFVAIGVLAFVAAPWVVRALAPGFDAGTNAMGAAMLRWMAPSILASALFLVIETLQNAGHHFSTSARARVWGRGSVVVALLLLTGPLGADAMPVSFVIGTVVQLVALGPGGLDVWRGDRPPFRPLLPGTRAVLALLLPAALWMLLDQLKFVVDQNFASRLAEGKLAALGYAYGLIQVIVAVTGGAYLTALFPRLSDEMAGGRRLTDTVTRATARVLLLSGAFTAVLMAAAVPIVTVVLERGAFQKSATVDTADALLWYAPSVIFIAVNMLWKILLFLTRRTGPILLVGLFELVLNVALDWLLIEPMGVGGLALATSATTLVVMLVLPVHLARQGLLSLRPVVAVGLRSLPGMIAAGGLMLLATSLAGPGGGLRVAAVLGVGAALAAAATLGAARLTGLLSLAVGSAPSDRAPRTEPEEP